MPVGVHVEVDAAKASAEFKAARREINKTTKEGLRVAGEKIVLPQAKTFAPSRTGKLKSSLVVKSTTRSAYLTTNLRGKKGRYVGIQEFGATIRQPIRHTKAKALYINGRFASSVTTPRVIKGQHFMSRAVEVKRSQINDAILEETMKAFEGFES